MEIAVIGAGRVGSALGRRWAERGHSVTFGVRRPHDEDHRRLGRTAGIHDAVAGAEVVVLAIPWAAVEATVTGLWTGEAVVIDATNPMPASGEDRRTDGLSGGELVARWSGSSRVVKAFNTTGAENLADPDYGALRPVMFLAGDDDAAVATASMLADDLGFDPVVAGPLGSASDLEHLAALWVRLARRLGHGPDIAFGLLRRPSGPDRPAAPTGKS